MKLETYIKQNNISVRDFASKVGMSGKQVYDWMNGVSIPRESALKKIFVETNGCVGLDDFYQMPPLHGGAVHQNTEMCEVANE